MKDTKILKKELEELKKDKKIIVGVYQDKELVNIWEDEKTNIMHLMSDLYNKQFLKNNNTKISNKYNYSDTQEIKVIEKRYNYDETTTTFECVYYNVPTKCGYLDTFKINEVLNNANNNDNLSYKQMITELIETEYQGYENSSEYKNIMANIDNITINVLPKINSDLTIEEELDIVWKEINKYEIERTAKKS